MNKTFWDRVKVTYPEFADTIRAIVHDDETKDTQAEVLIPDPHERALFKQAMGGLMQDLSNAIAHLGNAYSLEETLPSQEPPAETVNDLENIKQQAEHAVYCTPLMDAFFFGAWMGQLGLVRLQRPPVETNDRNLD